LQLLRIRFNQNPRHGTAYGSEAKKRNAQWAPNGRVLR